MRKRTVEIEALREEIKTKVSAIPDTNFMWCVNYYFAEFPTKSKFENSNFFREFEFDNNLQDLLEQYFRLTPFTEFRTSLRQMSKQIIEALSKLTTNGMGLGALGFVSFIFTTILLVNKIYMVINRLFRATPRSGT